MKFHDYLKNEVLKTKPINENTAAAGKTDTFKGSQYMGSHHHEYVIWTTNTGYGWTGDAIEDTKKDNACVASHVHMIIDGKVMPCGDGHSHELEKPLEVRADIDIGAKDVVVTTPPRYGTGM